MHKLRTQTSCFPAALAFPTIPSRSTPWSARLRVPSIQASRTGSSNKQAAYCGWIARDHVSGRSPEGGPIDAQPTRDRKRLRSGRPMNNGASVHDFK